MNKKFALLVLFAVLFSLFAVPISNAATFDQVLQRWTKSRLYKGEDDITTLNIKATYYSAEFIEAYVQKEAQNNMWTQQETNDYKYNFLNALKIDEMIPIQIEFDNNAETMYLGPFDIMIGLRIGNKYYKPVDYDKRFNFKFQGKKEGLVYFPRYDEKTGKDLLKDAKNVILELKGTISPNMTNGNVTRFVWDVSNDNPATLYQGKTAARFETDRLLKRLEKLRKDEAELQKQLKSVQDEKATIQTRLDELAKQ